ncbi:hypothetical protein [Tenacibaculum sp. Bg11-29]|uniref:hypothetical protein n=1 Tax=Tenacibaculum sp. Bg11-29 TaxID=2058306 RepID=UPI0018E2B908|nr:hypothetical protein [Tenacibaculum sp. Bg11-29]
MEKIAIVMEMIIHKNIMNLLKYLTIITTFFFFSCSSGNTQGGIPITPCDVEEQGVSMSQGNGNLQYTFNYFYDDAKTIVQYVTGHPQGDYYHIYSTQSSPFLDFYTFAINAGDTSTFDQSWNTTAGSYYAVDGTPFPQHNTIVLNTITGGTQVGDAIKITYNGGFSYLPSIALTPVQGDFCVTIDEVINLAEYVYITDGTNLKVINASNPLAPSLTHTIPAPTSYYVNTFNSVAYVGYFDAIEPFVSFVNISNPPTSNIFGSIAKGGNYGRLTDVVQVDNLTYISDEHKGFHKLHIANTDYARVDIHDVMSMVKKGNSLAIIDFSVGLRKIDVTNANTPVITNTFNLTDVDIASYPHTSGSYHSWTRTDGTDFYIANINDKKFKKFKETNFGYNLINEVNINGYVTALTIEGNYAYITTKASSLAPLQTSFDGVTMVNLATMTVIDSKPLNAASGVVIKANYAYVTDANGLHIYDISSSNLNLVQTYSNGFGNYISL